MWAANEFLDYLKQSDEDLYAAADHYKEMVSQFARMKPTSSKIFWIAYEVADNLLDFMNALK